MIYATGDTHGNFKRFEPAFFPKQAEMGRDDYVIICGDFGGVWNGKKAEDKTLDWLESLPFTLLFISGNHENFDLLKKYPVEEWRGGRIQQIRPHMIHLMRGQVFELDGYTFFTMGGASSHDIEDGILDPAAPGFKELYADLRNTGAVSGSSTAPGGRKNCPPRRSMRRLKRTWKGSAIRWTTSSPTALPAAS